MKVDFADGLREKLIELNLLSKWDDCTAYSREKHDKEIRDKYKRSSEQSRLDKIFNRRK